LVGSVQGFQAFVVAAPKLLASTGQVSLLAMEVLEGWCGVKTEVEAVEMAKTAMMAAAVALE